MRFFLALPLFLVLSGCASVGTGPISSLQWGSDETEQFVLSVAKNKLSKPLAGMVKGHVVHGHYVAERQGCHFVVVDNLDTRETRHYQVCGEQVARFQEPPPAFPSSPDALELLWRVKEAALYQGRSEGTYKRYRIVSVVEGYPRTDGCAPVKTDVTYYSTLVDQTSQIVCPSMRR